MYIVIDVMAYYLLTNNPYCPCVIYSNEMLCSVLPFNTAMTYSAPNFAILLLIGPFRYLKQYARKIMVAIIYQTTLNYLSKYLTFLKVPNDSPVRFHVGLDIR